MLKHLPRWLFASVSKHFNDAIKDVSLTRGHTVKVYVEGMYRDTLKDEALIEIRMDGPWLTEISKNYWRAKLEVNILCQAIMIDTDFHIIHRLVGEVVEAFNETLPVYKYGSGDEDDGSLLFCLKLLQDPDGTKGDRLMVNHFGQVAPDRLLMHASVEGHYQVDFELQE